MIERYMTKEMKEVWSERNKFEKMLIIELTSLKVQSDLKLIPKEDYIKIKEKAFVDVKDIKRIEERTKHDVIAFTESVCSKMGEEKRWFHYGLTSTDVVDSAQSLILKDCNDIILKDMASFIKVLEEKALKYKNTLCIGRTHGVHAEVTSFGLKWLLWHDEAKRALKRFETERGQVEVIKLSGAVGNFNDISPLVEAKVAEELQMKSCDIATQVLSRDRHIGYLNSLAMISSLLEKIATEIRHLSRTEINEVSEAFSSGQKGSSAMPHKKNPITSENICGLARVVRSYLVASYDNNNLWHERDISHSSVERIILPDATTLCDYMLRRYTKLLDELVVNDDKMKENILLTKGNVFSSKVLLSLVEKGLTREEAYKIVQTAAFENNTSLKETLKMQNAPLTEEELDNIFENQNCLKNIDYIYTKVLRRK